MIKVQDIIKDFDFPMYHIGTDTTLNTWEELFEFFEVNSEDTVMDVHPFYKNDAFIKCVIVASSMDMYFYKDDNENYFPGIDKNKYDYILVSNRNRSNPKWSGSYIIYLEVKK